MNKQIEKQKFKILSIIFAFVFSLTATFNAAAAEENISWEENNASIGIYETDFTDLYDIDYLNTAAGIYESTYEKDVKNGIRIMLVNGGFVPAPETLLKDNVIFISAEKLANIIGLEIQADNNEEKISLKKDNLTLTMSTNGNGNLAEMNGESIELPGIPENVNGEIYVPLRFVVEKFGGNVEYIHDYLNTVCHKTYDGVPDINMIVVEMPSEHEKAYTVEEGLSTIKKMSVEEYNQIVELLKNRNESFDEEYPDYNPLSIKYTGYNIGRLYVYELKGYEKLPIFFNKYTGEVYSNMSALPFVCIDKGFANLSWLYQ
ncbi:MAG: copper amine oxidase N-terminal domain-containing protein [Clostridia bacterium]|jgi:hypothetical protein|nr:copper amine oxidase N-terminal domain-containing protein [Clostridia bacterium]MCI1999160.1 copper amine oxidase N-terminal domain-containing protein [Clostridia bacterium]MCI2014887.1 copper amine oxidase N-terminal domain-containing protein [Clostridia bacterium]